MVLAFNTQRSEVEVLASQLWTDTDGDQVLFTETPEGLFSAFDPGDTGLLTQIPDPATAYNGDDDQISIAEGALFNVQLVAENRDSNGDRSKGVHNPFLSVELLVASINSVQATYALSVRLSPEAQAIVDRVNRELLRSRAPHTVSSR